MADKYKDDIYDEFHDAVNMAPKERDKWLDTEKSKSDSDHMKQLASYVPRQLAQQSVGDASDTVWAYSLQNWGHDPAK
ncbi:MAG: DUF3140 domain-containing protein [Lewinella sp.]